MAKGTSNTVIDASQRHRNGLQAVRGGAALLVLLQHVAWIATYFSAGPDELVRSLGLGSTGVFLFFGLSGFLMASQMRRPPLRFIIDRVRRIYPGLLLAVMASGSALAIFGYESWPKFTTLLLLPTGVPDSIKIPYWTLIFEVQFYLVIIVLGRFGSSISLFMLLLWAIAILLLFPVAPEKPELASYPSWTDIFISFYNLYFIIGAGAFFSLRSCAVLKSEGAMGLVGMFIAMGSSWALPNFGRDYYLLMFLVVLLVIRGATVWVASGFLGKALSKIGDVSYGVYLIHISTCFCAMLIAKELNVDFSYWYAFAYVLAAGGSAAWAFGWLELRSQEFMKKWTSKYFESVRPSSPVFTRR